MMRYVIKFSSQFRKQLKMAKKSGKQLDKLETVVDMLANNLPLPKKYRDHALAGN